MATNNPGYPGGYEPPGKPQPAGRFDASPPYQQYHRLYVYHLDTVLLPPLDDPDLIGVWLEDGRPILFFHRAKDEFIANLCRDYKCQIIYQADLDYADWGLDRRKEITVLESDLRQEEPDTNVDLVVANLYPALLAELFARPDFWRGRLYLISGFIPAMEEGLLAALPLDRIRMLERLRDDRWCLWVLMTTS